jgi:hypothetical protein
VGVEQGGEKADAGRADRIAPAPLASPTLREPFRIVDAFLDPDEAAILRRHFEAHFAEPHRHGPATHELWNYWYVPDLCTCLRTSPEKVIPRTLVDRFHARLSTSRGEVHGPRTVRLAIAADGAVAEARPLVDRVVTAAGGDARPAVESIVRHIRKLRFDPRAQPSEAWIPIMLGGTLGRVEEQRGSEPAAAPEA